jgi:hypothetical protein
MDLFLAMFLISLPPSMRETVGTGNHKTAAAIVKAADALWDARGGHNPTVAAVTTQRSRSPAPANGKKSEKRSGKARSKSHPPSRLDFYSFQNPGNGVCKFHNYYAPQGSQVYFTLCLVGKLKSRRTLTGSAATSTHATAKAMHFSANAGRIFLTDKFTHDRYLVDTGATLSVVPCTSKATLSGPLLKGADGQPIPSWGFVKKNCPIPW